MSGIEVQILYPFHPRCGQTVGVLGRKLHGGEEHFIVRQPDSTLMLLPAWMTRPDADAFRLISDPRLPVNRLFDLRAWLECF